jgi:hypothetical protein
VRSLPYVERLAPLLAGLAIVSLGLPAAATTDLADCPPVQGVTCQGWAVSMASILTAGSLSGQLTVAEREEGFGASVASPAFAAARTSSGSRYMPPAPGGFANVQYVHVSRHRVVSGMNTFRLYVTVLP